MFLGIEIGGTKLQLGVGDGTEPRFAEFLRYEIEASRAAAGIRDQIIDGVTKLRQRHRIDCIGFGFGGPVDGESGTVIKSHQIDGWDGFPMSNWCRQQFGLPIALGNDCDVAALAEARFGGGRGKSTVFYVTVGTGIGGGFVNDGHIHGTHRPAASEIGHLRPGPLASRPDETVEAIASGWGIAAMARARIREERRSLDQLLATPVSPSNAADHEDLLQRCGGKLEELTAFNVGEAATNGNAIAGETVQQACNVLGWAIAQVVTLLAPEVVVVGGGVSLMGEDVFFRPLRSAIKTYVFPPLAESYEIRPAALGEAVVVHGAIALARAAADNAT
ncbi:MAG: ROK family protein [Planctomycetota bacterium]|nr:ROK family protein [Planctomycetota bacterium]